MARRLVNAGFPVTLYNRSREKAADLVHAGAQLAESPRAAATGADVIISMVADDGASRAVWLGDTGALAGAARGAVLVEASTLTVGWVRELAAAATAQGCELLDAPVTGSKSHAAAGELNFLVGGTAAAWERTRPVLAAMSRTQTHVGPTGSGALLKLINNFLCGVQAASAAEALALIERTDLDSAKAVEFLLGAAPGSPLVKTLLPRMQAHELTPNFKLALMAKDLAYSVKEAGALGMDLPLVKAALGTFQRAIAAGNGDDDFSAVVEPMRSRGTK